MASCLSSALCVCSIGLVAQCSTQCSTQCGPECSKRGMRHWPSETVGASHTWHDSASNAHSPPVLIMHALLLFKIEYTPRYQFHKLKYKLCTPNTKYMSHNKEKSCMAWHGLLLLHVNQMDVWNAEKIWLKNATQCQIIDEIYNVVNKKSNRYNNILPNILPFKIYLSIDQLNFTSLVFYSSNSQECCKDIYIQAHMPLSTFSPSSR